MPVRRLNYTKRRRITHADVDIMLRTDASDTPVFDAELNLAGYSFPADARVVIEAYRQTTLLRFDYGTATLLQAPADRSLADFETPDEVLFRVKVSATSTNAGMLLGEADKIRPREPDEQPDRRIPLLPSVPDDLGEEIWRIDFEGGTFLRVSRHLPDWKQTVQSQAFRAMVYPAAMRQILERILHIEKVTTTDDSADWRSRWLLFAASLPGSRALTTTPDEYDDWIEEAVAAFARQMRLRTRFIEELGG